MSSVTPNPPNSGTEGGLGFALDMAAGRGLEGTGQADTAESGGVRSQASTTNEHGDPKYPVGTCARANTGRELRFTILH